MLSRVAVDDIASKPATSSIALLEKIMDKTKQNILKEMRKSQQNVTNTSSVSQTTNATTPSTHERKESAVQQFMRGGNVKLNYSRDTEERVVVKNVRCSHSPVRRE